MTNTTIDVSTPSDHEVRVSRVFDAPRGLIFEAHTRPELVRRWLLGPPGWSMPVCDIDLREGGEYRYVWRSEADASEFGFQGRFREIQAPARVVHTERPDGMPEGGDAICTLLLTEDEGGRTTLTQTMWFPTRELRDQVIATGMTDGMAMSYDRLESMVPEFQAG